MHFSFVSTKFSFLHNLLFTCNVTFATLVRLFSSLFSFFSSNSCIFSPQYFFYSHVQNSTKSFCHCLSLSFRHLSLSSFILINPSLNHSWNVLSLSAVLFSPFFHFLFSFYSCIFPLETSLSSSLNHHTPSLALSISVYLSNSRSHFCPLSLSPLF